MIKQRLNLYKVWNDRRILLRQFSRMKVEQIDRVMRQKIQVDNIEDILSLARHDSVNNFKQYSYIKNIFATALKTNKYGTTSKSSHKILSQTISTISQYPLFQMDPQSLQKFHKLINDNIHQKDNELLEKCLLFVINSDPHVQNSAVFIEFVKFYVKDSVELLKSQLSIDVNEQNVLNTIKLFFLRIFQRGFMPRHPSYQRQLYINNHILFLNKMIHNKTLQTSLMLKKIHHENLISIKDFYQQEMKQNLYHHKNAILLQKLVQMVPYLCKSFQMQVELIQHESKYLRELYVKLFLAIEQPEMKNCIFLYDLVKNKNENKENIQGSLLDEFAIKAEKLFQEVKELRAFSNTHSDQSNLQRLNLSNEQIFLIMKNSVTLNLQPSILAKLVQVFSYQIQSPLIFKKYFPQIHKLISQLSSQQIDITPIKSTLYKEEIYQLIDLYETVELSQQNFAFQDDKLKKILSKSIEKKDIMHVGNEEILNLLKIYFSLSLSNPMIDLQHFKRQELLICFILRFLSDHHPNLPFDSVFQQILRILFSINSDLISRQNLLEKDFNDQDGNYPNTILQQLQNHLKKYSWKIKNSELKKVINEKLDL